LSSPIPRPLDEYIREGFASLEGNHDIKSLSSLQVFLERGQTTRMPFVVVVNDFCWSCDNSIGVKLSLGLDSSVFGLNIPEMYSRPNQNQI
jgi:hypothetical protein